MEQKNKSQKVFNPKQSVSIADDPIDKLEEDSLDTLKYATSLSEFITACETPLTVGIQGEWGSGKTSLMNMIKQQLNDATVEYQKIREGKRASNTENRPGQKYFELVWINTWEHSLLKTNEECLVSILEEIIEKISARSGSWQLANQAKSALSTVLKGAARVGASMTMGMHAGQVADEMLASSKTNGVKELRESLKQVIKQTKKEEKAHRFVVFVDDLDRLEPAVAVQILELLKNIFTIPDCVFVLAIDYQVVVKGLEAKFGPPSEQNEWEFRAFFDKIIQVPFMMPMAQYKLDEYVISKLVKEENKDGIDYFTKKEVKNLAGGSLGAIAELTIGNNPRAIKRLLNSVSLIRLQNVSESGGPIKLRNFDPEKNQQVTVEHLETSAQLAFKQLIFALVCIQIAYPRTYELLLRESNFRGWDDEFFGKITNGKTYRAQALETALESIDNTNRQDFDDPWEKTLFKIIWVMEWQRNRIVDISRILSELEDTVLAAYKNKDEQFKILMDNGLAMTAVTSIASTSDSVLAKNKSSTEKVNNSNSTKYWMELSGALKTADIKCTFTDYPPRAIHTSGYLTRVMDRVQVELLAKISSQTPLVVKVGKKDPDDYQLLMQAIRSNIAELEAKVGTCRVKNLEGPAKNIELWFGSPVTTQVDLLKDESAAGEVINWMTKHIETIENFIREMDESKGTDRSTSI